MHEAEVREAFAQHLRARGWTVPDPVPADLVAHRGARRLAVEVVGRTADPGPDVDAMYGRLLRRMHEGTEVTRYAVVVPAGQAPTATRVPAVVRERLGIEVWLVDEAGAVVLHDPPG